MQVKVTMNTGWEKNIENGMKEAVLDMATDIHRRAIILAPKDTRALVNSGVIDPVQNGYKITFGSSKVPYARRRHFENKKNPSSKGYLAKAGDSVARSDKSKYFKGKV
jgi:hypothetical protein